MLGSALANAGLNARCQALGVNCQGPGVSCYATQEVTSKIQDGSHSHSRTPLGNFTAIYFYKRQRNLLNQMCKNYSEPSEKRLVTWFLMIPKETMWGEHFSVFSFSTVCCVPCSHSWHSLSCRIKLETQNLDLFNSRDVTRHLKFQIY